MNNKNTITKRKKLQEVLKFYWSDVYMKRDVTELKRYWENHDDGWSQNVLQSVE